MKKVNYKMPNTNAFEKGTETSEVAPPAKRYIIG